MTNKRNATLKDRFRKFLPVVIDIETAGVNPLTDALLEISSIIVEKNEHGTFYSGHTTNHHIAPFEGANLDKESLEFNKIDPFHPFRFAKEEAEVLNDIFSPIWQALKEHQCQKAVLVGHNAWFDLHFLNAAIKRTKIKSPFHSFTCFDTATLAGVFYGQTVLAKACQAANIKFDVNEAHSAIYDAKKTSELFCSILNLWEEKK